MTPTLSRDEIVSLTGGYRKPAKQLAELHRQGFHRARRSMLTGQVVLERAHYEAVCRGSDAQSDAWQPKLRPA